MYYFLWIVTTDIGGGPLETLGSGWLPNRSTID